jgi:Leucine-rich repeat (LRR) protein
MSLNFSESGWWGRIFLAMKVLISIVIGLLVVGCGGSKEKVAPKSQAKTDATLKAKVKAKPKADAKKTEPPKSTPEKRIVEEAIWDQLRADYREGMDALRDPGLSEEKRNDLHTQTEAIREKLKQPTGELAKADLEKVAKLNLSSKKLTGVPKGMEKLTKLTSLILHSNKLTNLKGLENLTQLKDLVLNINQLTDVKELENLTQLTVLYLESNQLTNVKGLEKLTQLTYLSLDSNRLTEVKGLQNLTQLTALYLSRN